MSSLEMTVDGLDVSFEESGLQAGLSNEGFQPTVEPCGCAARKEDAQ